jgi:hypothetical protein
VKKIKIKWAKNLAAVISERENLKDKPYISERDNKIHSKEIVYGKV